MISWVFRGHHEVGEGLGARGVDLGPLGRVHLDHVIDVQQDRVALDQDVQAEVLLQGQVGAPVGQGVALSSRPRR